MIGLVEWRNFLFFVVLFVRMFPESNTRKCHLGLTVSGLLLILPLFIVDVRNILFPTRCPILISSFSLQSFPISICDQRTSKQIPVIVCPFLPCLAITVCPKPCPRFHFIIEYRTSTLHTKTNIYVILMLTITAVVVKL